MWPLWRVAGYRLTLHKSLSGACCWIAPLGASCSNPRMSELALLPDAEVDRAAGYARQALSPATPVTVAAYLAAVGHAHRMAGHAWSGSHPAIRDTLAGIARRHGTPRRRAAAIDTAEIRKPVATCSDGLTGMRDRALLLLGFAAALRRSELVAAQRKHLIVTPNGLLLLIPRVKADQQGRGSNSASRVARSPRPVRSARRRPGCRPASAATTQCFSGSTAGATLRPPPCACMSCRGSWQGGCRSPASDYRTGAALDAWPQGRLHPRRLQGRGARQNHRVAQLLLRHPHHAQQVLPREFGRGAPGRARRAMHRQGCCALQPAL